MMIPLGRSERRTAIVGILTLTIWAVHIFAVKPVKSRIATLHRVIPQKQQERKDLDDIINCYKGLRNSVGLLQQQIENQDPTFELLPHLEASLETLQLKTSVSQMDQTIIPLDAVYSENIVEVVLESVTLGQIVEFIQSIEVLEGPIQIRSAYVGHHPANRERLNCTLSLHHLRMAQPQV